MTLFDRLLETAFSLTQLLDELSFPQLAVLAFVMRFAAFHVATPDTTKAPQAVGVVSMLVYLAHWAVQGNRDTAWLLLYLLRSGLVYVVAAAIATPIVIAAASIAGQLDQLFVCVHLWLAEWRRHIADRLHQATHDPEPSRAEGPPPPSRTERMQQEAAAAREEFDAEAGVIQSLPLDEDEREVMILRARQRLLQKLAQLTER